MRRSKGAILVLALISGVALAAGEPASAAAAGPEFTASNTFLTGLSASWVWEMPTLGNRMECNTGTSAGNTGTGSIGTATTTFRECEVPGIGYCHSAGHIPGIVESELLNAELVWIDQAAGNFGVLYAPTGATVTTFECEGIEFVVAGSVRGQITAPPLNTLTTQFTVALGPTLGGQNLVTEVKSGGVPLGTFPLTLEGASVETLAGGEEGEFVE